MKHRNNPHDNTQDNSRDNSYDNSYDKAIPSSSLDLTLLGALFAMAGLPKTVGTKQAAEMLNRSPVTLRRWGRKGNGPIQPVRINGRLSWRVTDIIGVLNGGAQ